MKSKTKKSISLFMLVFVLAIALIVGTSGIASFADEAISTGQGMSETVSGGGSEEDSGNGGDAGPIEDSGNGGDAGPIEDSGNGGDVGGDYTEPEEPAELPEFSKDVEDAKKLVRIGTAQELYALAEAVNSGSFAQVYDTVLSNAKIMLTNDIDLSSYRSGGGFVPIGSKEHAFKGEFDGGGYKISNLVINSEDGVCQGLFGVLGKGGNVHDVILTGVKINAKALAGGIAGIAEFASISNCKVDGDISVNDSLAGGIAGGAIECVIENCETSGKVAAKIENAGGIAGQVGFDNCVIRNCSSSMVITVSWGAGGIAGSVMNATVEGCSFSGKIASESDASGSMVGDVMEVDLEGGTVAPEYETDNDANELDAPVRDTGASPKNPGEPKDEEQGVSTDVL